MQKKKKSRIPEFKSLEEEAEFWDTHDVTDFMDELTPVKAIVHLRKPKEEVLTVRLQSGIKQRMARLATQMGVNTSTLARMWIIEKMRQTT